MEDSELAELFEVIAGRGKWRFIGGAGFHTHPQADSRLHEACCELERRGWVERIVDEPHHCCFKATEAGLKECQITVDIYEHQLNPWTVN